MAVMEEEDLSTQDLQCRMYEERYPEVDQTVMVQVKSIAEMGAYVSLLEYDGVEGMILLSELSRRRIRSVNKLIRVGRQEAVVVLRVDKEKGYIDLSKRRVTPEEIEKLDVKWNKSKTVHSIMRQVSSRVHIPVEELQRQIAWPLYKKFGHAYNAFKLAVSDPEPVFEGLDITPAVRAELMKQIDRRLTPQAVKIRADVEVTCFKYEGIDAVKDALLEGLKLSTEDFPMSIKLIAPPLYVISTVSLDREEGVALVKRVCDTIAARIAHHGGDINIKQEARAVTEKDEKVLAAQLEQYEMQNRQVDGDDDIDEI
jgi:translation initiation factor 2 subunit 1